MTTSMTTTSMPDLTPMLAKAAATGGAAYGVMSVVGPAAPFATRVGRWLG